MLRNLVRRRRMVRAFSADPVPAATVDRLIDLARRAPTAGNAQGISFVVVTDSATRQAVARIAGEAWYTAKGHPPFLSGAPVQVVLCAEEATYRARYREADKRKAREAERAFSAPWWFVDAGGALVLLLFAAVEEGLAASFVGVREPADLAAALGIPAGVHPVGVVLLGQPAPARRGPSPRALVSATRIRMCRPPPLLLRTEIGGRHHVPSPRG
ncbi:MAG: nitroreductase [Chloroflexi bacterium]|nr:nitroreductase [Chloroflexota bacterium]